MFNLSTYSTFGACYQAADKSGSGYEGTYPEFPRITFNPLRAEVGRSLRINDPDLEQLELGVDQILNTTVDHGGERYVLADYALEADGNDSCAHLADEDGKVRIRLRCISDGAGGFEATVFQAQWLTDHAGDAFRSLARTSQASLTDAEGERADGFKRIDGVTDVYSGSRTVVGDPGSVGDQEGGLSLHTIIYLDYDRWNETDSGEGYSQWALVEFNSQSQDMMTLFGWSIDPRSIEVAP
jgi:hypothetical protein